MARTPTTSLKTLRTYLEDKTKRQNWRRKMIQHIVAHSAGINRNKAKQLARVTVDKMLAEARGDAR